MHLRKCRNVNARMTVQLEIAMIEAEKVNIMVCGF